MHVINYLLLMEGAMVSEPSFPATPCIVIVIADDDDDGGWLIRCGGARDILLLGPPSRRAAEGSAIEASQSSNSLMVSSRLYAELDAALPVRSVDVVVAVGGRGALNDSMSDCLSLRADVNVLDLCGPGGKAAFGKVFAIV
jgi:hypothetical protein